MAPRIRNCVRLGVIVGCVSLALLFIINPHAMHHRHGLHYCPDGDLALAYNTSLTISGDLSKLRCTNGSPSLPHVQRDVSRDSIRRVLHYLNLTHDQTPHYLPLTLRGHWLLSNNSLCVTDDGRPVDILFLVHTAPDHHARRHKLRTTFMAANYFLPFRFTVRRVFLLGRVENGSQQASLEAEHGQHGDLVQGDFLDTYHNLSHKGVMGFRWVATHCPRAKLLVKLDDDVFFDTFKLIHRHWPKVKAKRRAIFCSVWRNNSMPVLRTGKWTVAERLFRQMALFPYNYCSGLAVLLTGDLAPVLLKAARRTPVFWIDDIYLFGILPAVASDVTFYDVGYAHDGMTLHWERGLSCLKDKGHNCPLLAALAQGEQLDALWNKSLALHSDSPWQHPLVTV